MPASGALDALLVLEPLKGPGRCCPYHGTQCCAFRTDRRAQHRWCSDTRPWPTTLGSGLGRKGRCRFRSPT